MLVAGKFAWNPHVKLPVNYLWYSGKFICARKQCACVLREVLAASKQVNLPVITGKLHVTQVNCARDLFTCELQVKLPAFAGNFARASFTVLFCYCFLNFFRWVLYISNPIEPSTSKLYGLSDFLCVWLIFFTASDWRFFTGSNLFLSYWKTRFYSF